MPGQVDGNLVEVLSTAQDQLDVQASMVEVLWGSPGTIPLAESATHVSVLEVLSTAQDQLDFQASMVEVLWRDLVSPIDLDAEIVEVLWGSSGTIPTTESSTFASMVEVLSTPVDQLDVQASVVEVLVQYHQAVAVVGDEAGILGSLTTFDGSVSTGLIRQYRWNWVTVPGGSALGNASTPFPDGGAVSPIDMTSNLVLYHAEETVGTTGVDTSGNANNATLTSITVGMPGVVGLRSWETLGATSKAVPISSVVAGVSWTLSFWFFNLAPNTAQRIGSRGFSEGHLVVESGGDRVGTFVGGVFRPTDTGFTMLPGVYTGWHHMVAVGGAGGSTRIYVNGFFVGSCVGFRTTQNFEVFGNSQIGNERFADRVDEIAVWGRELSEAEILDIYVLQNGNFTGIGATHQFLPDVAGTYTINLTVVDAVNNLLSSDTADAVINLPSGGLLFPLQGDEIRMWAPMQGQRFRSLTEDE